MVRFNFLLLSVVLMTAFAVVNTQYEARRLLSDTFKVQRQEAVMLAQYERLMVARRAASNNMQVESQAREKMGMTFIRPGVTHYYFRDQKDATDVQKLKPASDASGSSASLPALNAPAKTPGGRP